MCFEDCYAGLAGNHQAYGRVSWMKYYCLFYMYRGGVIYGANAIGLNMLACLLGEKFFFDRCI